MKSNPDFTTSDNLQKEYARLIRAARLHALAQMLTIAFSVAGLALTIIGFIGMVR